MRSFGLGETLLFSRAEASTRIFKLSSTEAT